MADEEPQTLGDVWKSPPHRRGLLAWMFLHAMIGPALGIFAAIKGAYVPWALLIVMGILMAPLGIMRYLDQLDERRVTGADYLNRRELRRLRQKATESPAAAAAYLAAIERHIEQVQLLSQVDSGFAKRAVRGWDFPWILRALERERDAMRRRLGKGAA